MFVSSLLFAFLARKKKVVKNVMSRYHRYRFLCHWRLGTETLLAVLLALQGWSMILTVFCSVFCFVNSTVDPMAT